MRAFGIFMLGIIVATAICVVGRIAFGVRPDFSEFMVVALAIIAMNAVDRVFEQ